MNTVYILSFYNVLKPFNNVRGVFSTRENAFINLGRFMNPDEEIYDYEENEGIWLFFTNRGTWELKEMMVDESSC